MLSDKIISMKKSIFKKRKTRRLLTIIICIPLFFVILLLGFNIISTVKNIKNSSVTSNKNSLDNIEGYDYHLRHNATSIQKEYFKQLEKELNKNEKEDSLIAELIVKNYVADMYTWSNKAGSYDVGGVYYLYSPTRINLYLQAQNHFYKYFAIYKNEYGVNNLIEVESVEANVLAQDKNLFKVQDAEMIYRVVATWVYKDKAKFDENIFTNRGEFYVIKNKDGRFEIIVGWE